MIDMHEAQRMLQDDDRKLSRWLADKPGARRQATEAAHDITPPTDTQPAGYTIAEAGYDVDAAGTFTG